MAGIVCVTVLGLSAIAVCCWLAARKMDHKRARSADVVVDPKKEKKPPTSTLPPIPAAAAIDAENLSQQASGEPVQHHYNQHHHRQQQHHQQAGPTDNLYSSTTVTKMSPVLHPSHYFCTRYRTNTTLLYYTTRVREEVPSELTLVHKYARK